MTRDNSYGIAQKHKKAWISAYSNSGGNGMYRDHKPAYWLVHAPVGHAFTPDPAEKIYALYHNEKSIHVFHTFGDAAEYCEKHFGITGWKRDHMGGFHPSDTDHDVPCGEFISRPGRMSSFTVCDKKVKPGESMCGVHLRTAANRVIKAQEERVHKERSESGSRIAQDAIDALASLDINGSMHYNSRNWSYTGAVEVHAEDILTLVREVKEYREMRDL